ncbi:MFS transporter [Actinospongicola halichondriae]|uniref:MFS transporter n=1 Tax=Actinospongicola halichondriae TaxID=3236844 RepID=UPI003D3B812E
MGSLRDTRVRAFLVAEAVSAIGTWATLIAIWGYAAFEFDATAAEVSLFGVALTLPAVVLGPVVGAVIDRFGPRLTLGAAKAVGVAASLALLTADDFRTLALLSAVHGVVGAFTHPALQSLPPRIVAEHELARTNALVSLTDEFAIVMGPVVGALAIATVGFRGAFVVDAVTYLLGLVVLPAISIRDVEVDADAPPVRLRDAFEGLRLIRRTPLLRRTVIAMSSVHLLYGAAILAEPLYVRDVLERSPSVFAALQTAFGVCLVLGGLLVARLSDRLATFGWVAFGAAASGVTALVYFATAQLLVAFAGVALWGLFTALLSGPSRTLLQRNSPEAVHGRVLATDFVAASAAQLVGIGVTGVLISTFGVPTAMTALGLSVTLVAVGLDRGQRREASIAPAVTG